jgi:hypothetical protein
MAPQPLEKIESRRGNGMGSKASNIQDLVPGRAADRATPAYAGRGSVDDRRLRAGNNGYLFL